MFSHQNSFCSSFFKRALPPSNDRARSAAIANTEERKLRPPPRRYAPLHYRFWRRKHFEPYKLDWQRRITLVSIFYPRQLVILHIYYSIVFDMLPPPKLHFFATFLALYSSSVPGAVKQRPSVCVCIMRTKAFGLTSSTLFICILRAALPCTFWLAIILCRMP